MGQLILGILNRFNLSFSDEYYINQIRIDRTRQVSSMIHSARPTVSPVANIVCAWNFVLFWKVGTDERTNGRHVHNNDHYRPWLWVGLLDRFLYFIFFDMCTCTISNRDTGHWIMKFSLYCTYGIYFIFGCLNTVLKLFHISWMVMLIS